jgi:hypothetical protein
MFVSVKGYSGEGPHPSPSPLRGRGAFIRAQSEATRGVRSWLVVGGRLGDQVVESVGR